MFWFISRKKVFHSAQNGFPAYIDLSIPGSLARELPAVVADTAKAEGVAFGRSDSTRCAPPRPNTRGVAERRFHSAAEDFPTTWIPRYPAPSRGSCREAEGVAFGRSDSTRCAFSTAERRGASQRPKKFSYYINLSIPGSLARELPAVVADTAKAEGVAYKPQQFPTLRILNSRAERGFPAAEKILLLHKSFNTRLPREGAARGRRRHR